MGQVKTYKCAFKHCKHENEDIPQNEAVKVGNRYMHDDCSKISENITQIRDIYYEKVSNTVVVKQLVSAINTLVFTKKIDSEYLLFALNYAITNKTPIKSPYGLHYLVDNNRIKDAWKKKQSSVIKKQIENEEITYEEPNQTSFNFTVERNTGFGGIFKGGN